MFNFKHNIHISRYSNLAHVSFPLFSVQTLFLSSQTSFIITFGGYSILQVIFCFMMAFFHFRKNVWLIFIGWRSEFDIAALVVYVGEVYKAANQKKQWMFVTDGSMSDLHLEKYSSKSLLAISFCSPSIDQDSYAPVNHNLAGSTVSTCSVYSEILFALHTGRYEGNNDDTHAYFGNKK